MNDEAPKEELYLLIHFIAIIGEGSKAEMERLKVRVLEAKPEEECRLMVISHKKWSDSWDEDEDEDEEDEDEDESRYDERNILHL